ncbi:MFS transporter [Streptomyces sp. NRRL F-5123]|uniref:MFS transporter n=1 Tax=Streptomyces sp. NRRL F-5123 TaxID=1463856 RepID=UPI00099CE344|nr:MFS transporter [Streptomyces sp. NRRL F-5123]
MSVAGDRKAAPGVVPGEGAVAGTGSGPDEGGILGREYRALTFGVVSVVLLVAFEATAVGTAMPVAARDLHGLGLYAFGFSGYFTTSLFAMVVSGQWCDRGGPLAPLATGIAAFAAGLVISGTAGTMGVFVLGRAVQGLGGGLVIVALYVVVGLAYPERLRPAVMASFSASWVVPSIVGPLVSGTVTEQLGWRWVFLAIPVLVVLPLAVMLPALRRTAAHAAPRDTARPRMDGRRIGLAALLALGAVLLQYAGQDLRPLSVLPALAGAGLMVPAALRLLPRGTFRAARGLPTIVLMRGLAAGTFAAAETFIPLMLVTQRGLSPTLAGLSLAGGGLTWALGSYLQARPRFEPVRERLVQVGMLLTAGAIAVVPLALDHAVPTAVVAVAWCAGGMGMGMTISTLTVLMLRVSRPADTGTNSAALQVGDALANVVLVGAAGSVFAALGGGSVAPVAHAAARTAAHPAAFAAVFLPAAALALAAAAISRRLRPKAG